MNVVLFEPVIPQNTGNIARTCAVTGTSLHLIRPYGFQITERHLKRAGLDYWDKLLLAEYDDYQSFLSINPGCRVILATSHAEKLYTDIAYQPDDYLLFGSETSGLPEDIHERYIQTRVKIPMTMDLSARCLNLSNAVGIVLYEALRQQNFKGLKS